MSKPIRIQRKRTKGWKMPPNTVYVGRPTKWGNPLETKREFDLWIRGKIFIEFRQDLRNDILGHVYELRGYNLSCWCKIGEPCHADVLLELANG